MREAHSYDRFSSGPQRGGMSLERQADYAAAACAEHKWRLNTTLTFKDPACSAFRGKHRRPSNRRRGGLADFMQAIKNKVVKHGSVLIIEAFNRLSREPLNSAFNLFQEIIHAGVDIYVCRNQTLYTRRSLDELETMMMVQLEISRAHQESKEKSDWGKKRWAKRHRLAESEHKPHGMRPPAWLRRVGDGYEFRPERLTVLREVLRWYREDGIGRGKILARLLSDPKRYPPWGRKAAWQDRYLQKILTHPALWGAYQRHTLDSEGRAQPIGEPIPGYYPAVMSREEWEDLQRLAKRRSGKGGGRPPNRINVLRGLAKDTVGADLYMATEASRGYSYCYLTRHPDTMRRLKIGPNNVPYEAIELAVLRLVPELKPADVQPGAAQVEDQDARVDGLRGERDQLDRALAARQRQLEDPALVGDLLPEVLSAMRTLKTRRSEVDALLGEEAAASRTSAAVALEECQSLVSVRERAEGEERQQIDRRIHALLPQFVEGVWLHTQTVTRRARWVHIQVWLRSGVCHYTKAITGCRMPGAPAADLSGVDFRAGYSEPLPRKG